MLLRITNKCKMNCNHCMINSTPEGKHMSMDTLDNVIEYIKKVNPCVVLISGGEPTEHPNFFEIVEKITKIIGKQRVLVASNGMFLEDLEMTKKIESLGIQFQITNDSRYYPISIKPKREYKNIIFVDKIQQMYPLGRAVKNNLPTNANAPKCFNLRSIAKLNANNMIELVNLLEWQSHKFCTSSIDIYGNIHAGETDECFVIGNVINDIDEIFNNLKNMDLGKCNKCRLENNLPIQYQTILNCK